VQDRRFPCTRAARDHRVFLRKPERWDRLLEIPHDPAHLDLLEDESLRARRRLQIRDRGGFDLRIVPHERASLSTRRASTLIISRFGWSARTLSTYSASRRPGCDVNGSVMTRGRLAEVD